MYFLNTPEVRVPQSPNPEARFRRLFDENEAAMREYMSRRMTATDANDATAEVFLVAWRKIDEVPPAEEARLWLYGVARNVVRNISRSNDRRSRLFGKASSVRQPASAAAEDQVVRRSEDAAVLAALETLPQSDRELLRLRTWEELSSAELASVFGVSPSAIDMRLTRAKRRMAAAMRRAGYPQPDQATYPHAAEERGS